ncbi:16S rRNA pseudouridine(516) synthase RsuA [Aeromonas veronii]|uniref:16S rRNA pseudouridine(516) synthase RsuA n=1 Tax=Aeromonas veronii TaxID=654 RepID=UPI001FD25347|nr:16S rRNA pseudouridine(516) synthase RsuA [Aeromonas veronii]MCJ7974449.1 16S rRNA pseudouridine(516) synthase RsuA [Aeromonas veronii]UOR17470.1 16S rRNA pseudouridine(516) synthase RsuA [Aeromonas veronii]
MRLDKFLCDYSDLTRSLAGKLIRQGEVMVDGIVVKQPAFHINEQSQIEFDGVLLTLEQRNRYFMLHKPEGYVCSNEDPDHPTVFFLMDEPAMGKLHVVGRLDLDTTGLVLVTDDGQWSHRITSPRHECAKTYHVWLADPVSPDAIALFAEGVYLRNETDKTRPAQLEILGECEARLTIHEGKYHQVKRMFASIGNKVVGLHRERVGGLTLDDELAPGEYRELTAEEIALF